MNEVLYLFSLFNGLFFELFKCEDWFVKEIRGGGISPPLTLQGAQRANNPGYFRK